jgi:hypothetical protein
MNEERKRAALVGILYIAGTAFGVGSVVATAPVLGAGDLTGAIAARGSCLAVGSLLVLAMGFSLAFIPVLLHPVLKKVDRDLALGYVVFRGGLETFTYLGTAGLWMAVVSLGRLASDGSELDFAATLLASGGLGQVLTILAFGLGALMLYSLLYRSRLVPRWLSLWGFVAIGLHLATGILLLFGLAASASPILTLMNLPILVQEMVMATWFIVKGFGGVATRQQVEA